MTNSRDKGKRGEREARDKLNELFGWGCRRGQQFCGGAESGDLAGIPAAVHFEIKRVERLDLSAAMSQSIADSGGKVPVVMHKKNRGKWMLTVCVDDLQRLIQELAAPAAGGECNES